MPSVLIAGGGLVGSLNACLFGKRGWKVTIVESRSDPRGTQLEPGKSINLALGYRGMLALERIGLKNKVLEMGVAITERKLHVGKAGGKKQKLPVLNQGDFVLTINRHELSQLLIDQADKFENVKYHFNTKINYFDINNEELVFANGQFPEKHDLILACDGAHSSIRRSLLRIPLFNFQQKYIEFGYMDLSVKLDSTNNNLELGVHNTWIRERVILVALLNLDNSLTVSVFAKFLEFQRISENPIDFFKKNFSDLYDILGQKHISESFDRHKPQAIISVKCSQHAFFDKLLLMGDAAHAMVPFNGQGVNCGFEDCLVLQEMLEKTENLAEAIGMYSLERTIETNAMNQMAWNSNLEIDRLVYNHPIQCINRLEEVVRVALHKFIGSPLVLCTFSRTPYSQIEEKIKFQDKAISYFVVMIIVAFIVLWVSTIIMF